MHNLYSLKNYTDYFVNFVCNLVQSDVFFVEAGVVKTVTVQTDCNVYQFDTDTVALVEWSGKGVYPTATFSLQTAAVTPHNWYSVLTAAGLQRSLFSNFELN